MTDNQKLVFWVLLPLALLALAIGGFVALMPLGIIPLVAWCILVCVVVGITLAETVYFLRPDRMILASFLSKPYKLYSPIEGEDPGLLGGIILIFPPFLATGLVLPVTGFDVPFEHSGAVTDDVKKDEANNIERDPATPVTVFAGLVLKLPTKTVDLIRFIQSIPVLQGYRNLCKEVNLNYLERIDAVTGKPITASRKAPLIARIIRDTLGGTFGEALGRAIPAHSFSKVMENRIDIENSVELHMAGMEWIEEEKEGVKKKEKGKREKGKWIIKETIASDARIFYPPESLDLHDKDAEPVSKMRLNDFNIGGIVASSEKVMAALSSEQEAIRIARGRGAEGQGEADRLRPMREQVALPGGREALASITLRDIKPNNLNIVAATDMLTAGIASLATTQQPAPQQPAAPPPKPAETP